MNFLGIDPDLHNTALGLVNERGAVAVQMIRSGKRGHVTAKGANAVVHMLEAIRTQITPWANKLEAAGLQDPMRIAIESQRVYKESPVDPDDLIHLAQVAGAVALAARALWPAATIVMPYPADWKGQVPKGIHHGRVLTKLGLPHACSHGKATAKGAYCYVTKAPATFYGAGALSQTDWKHAVDALGLALYVRD